MRSSQTSSRRPKDTAVAAWEDDGGATAAGAVIKPKGSADRPVLEALGAAVVARWNDLPTAARRVLFKTAAPGCRTSVQLARVLRARPPDPSS